MCCQCCCCCLALLSRKCRHGFKCRFLYSALSARRSLDPAAGRQIMEVSSASPACNIMERPSGASSRARRPISPSATRCSGRVLRKTSRSTRASRIPARLDKSGTFVFSPFFSKAKGANSLVDSNNRLFSVVLLRFVISPLFVTAHATC